LLLQQINRARSDGRVCGTTIMAPVPALAWNDILFSAAARHSQDMVANNYFAHDSQNGTGFSQRMAQEGYGWSAAGENIAGGQPTVASVMAAWLTSEGHCRNIMQPVFRDVGVACVPGGSYGSSWTMDLGG
jgi:uncharacterized protein YkwD